MIKVPQKSSKFQYLLNGFAEKELDEETQFKTKSLSRLGRAFNVYVQLDPYVSEYPQLVGYFATGKANDDTYASSALTAQDIENCDVSLYMNGYDIIDFEGMLRAYPEMFYA